jgi:hypothetical protein
VLPASAHKIEEFMNAADEKRQLHQFMRARQRLNASLHAQVSGRPLALRNGDSFLYWRTSVVRSQIGWRGPAIVIAQQRNMVIGFIIGIVVLCHRTRDRFFERSSRDEKPSPLLDDDALLPFQGTGVDSSASSALTAQDADDFVQSPFVTEFMPAEFEDVEFRDVVENGRHLRVFSDDPEQAARVGHASAAGPASNLFQLMNTAPVRDTVPDVSSSADEPVTSVQHMDDDDDDDDRPPGEVLTSDSPHDLELSHSAPEHVFQPNADSVADFSSLRIRSKRPVPDEDDDNSVDKNAEAETKRKRIHLAAALYPYYSTLDDEGDEIGWDQLSDEEFESKMEELKVKERERITHRDIALRRYKDLAFRTYDKSKSYCRPLLKYPPVDVFREERGGMSTQTVYLSHQKNKRVVLLSYDEAKNNPSSFQAIEEEIASIKRFDCY